MRRLTINMNSKIALQTAGLIVAGVVLALCANAFASHDRKLALVGSYPNALKVPPHEAAPPPAPQMTIIPQVPTTSQAPAPSAATAATVTQTTATAANETMGLNPAARNPAAITTTTSAPHAPSPPPPITNEDPLKRFPAHPDKPYLEIAFADVKWLHEKNVLFLDARRTSVYEQGHIAGARTYSVWESDVDDKVQKLYAERGDPREQANPIVIYCSGGDCEDSHMLAQKLWGIQFNNLYVYKDGFPDWQQHGAQVHTGVKP